ASFHGFPRNSTDFYSSFPTWFYLKIVTKRVATDIKIPVADSHRLVDVPMVEFWALILLGST
ncbi:MAG: hypothetical protein II133_02010, partial [Lachnospiraceae bacterium]|nr:hypothetical protein [Lachnospiraceae bacterium]